MPSANLLYEQILLDKLKEAENTCLTRFSQTVQDIDLPEKFTFPFYYEPHRLCVLAAEETQQLLSSEANLNHNFGLDPKMSGMVIGKMFGVLVVKDSKGKLGYIRAFSGKLGNKNLHPGFVPPLFDMLSEDGFFRKEEQTLNAITHQIEALERSPDLQSLKEEVDTFKSLSAEEIAKKKSQNKEAKILRDELRDKARATMIDTDFEQFNQELAIQSLQKKYELSDLTRDWNRKIARKQEEVDLLVNEINALRKERKKRSGALQQQLFDQYHFLNINGITKSLISIFEKTAYGKPPAGAGECAAPKLLQYAFQHNLKPIAMAEFWWGASPKSEIRKHKNYYPACRGKCEPILSHMLTGMTIDDNPMLMGPSASIKLETVYEDEFLLVINKPADILSVPGRNVADSVLLRIQKQYPGATGPLVVHRLDMSTSGLMLIAKTKDIHKRLQRQFIKRTIEKKYIALLDGIIDKNQGTIDLPMRLDFIDRPRQMVCFDEGKKAITDWKVLERKEQQTRIEFKPITGRTHQLRVHSAHQEGLNTPIVGDELYGKKGKRLCLHAAEITFLHPIRAEKMTVYAEPDF